MQPLAYYNEIDKFAAQWLRNLIDAGHIAPGIVDTRSIEEVTANDFKGFTQCHFFAGVGVWSYALRRAGWPDSKPVWTGSCPCQPFSAAGKRGGVADERHLWPAFFHLIQQRRPDVVFGEQVASSDGRAWFDTVQADMENVGYACAAIDLCAAGVGAPNVRQRLFWVAHANSMGRIWRGGGGNCNEQSQSNAPAGCGTPGWMADAERSGWGSFTAESTAQNGCNEQTSGDASSRGGAGLAIEVNGFWRDADWIFCRDEKWRPVEPGAFPLANGVTSRVGRLRAYGNAINAEVAAAFVSAYMNRGRA
ncbi:DNA cytosine methyltransferase [Dickeya dianthicola]|uniref:DNA cytosine methyltransferase n=1 Tax=Dickeya dianthicola TaxID=204039 RepID=UPI0018686BE7|nr:DNA cytosine methyltransferase [Dickeya dianthicola]QOL13276.1 DNA cytosine methyltransferase [Dickeya dianthicola]